MLFRFTDFILEQESTDNSFFNYLKSIIDGTSGKQKEFYQWQRKNAEVVEMVSPELLIPELTEKWAKKRLRVKDCYKNASLVMDLNPEIKYVEGVMMLWDKIPIDHAWNSYNGKHFDATSHLWSKSDEKDLHIKLIELDYDALWDVLRDQQMHGEVLNYLYRKGKLPM